MVEQNNKNENLIGLLNFKVGNIKELITREEQAVGGIDSQELRRDLQELETQKKKIESVNTILDIYCNYESDVYQSVSE